MICTETPEWVAKLSVFRAELADLAFAMDRRGRAEAADVALMAFARIGEICDELHPSQPASVVLNRADEIK
jgi:hypothetical protein